MKSVPVRTAKELRDLTAAASQIGEWDKLGCEGKLTLNVLNVEGDMWNTRDGESVERP